MRYRLSVGVMAAPVLMGLLGAAPQRHGTAAPTSPPNMIQIRTQYGLTPDAEAMLLRNGFLVLDQARYKALGDAYPFQHHISPMYVTTDAMLELWSSLNRDLLETTERQVCIKQLSAFLPALETRAKTLTPLPQTATSSNGISVEATAYAAPATLRPCWCVLV